MISEVLAIFSMADFAVDFSESIARFKRAAVSILYRMLRILIYLVSDESETEVEDVNFGENLSSPE